MSATADVVSSIGDVSLDATVQCVAGTLTADGMPFTSDTITATNCWFPYPYTPAVGYTISSFSTPSTFEQAFKVASHLLDKKLIKEPTLRQFIALVNEIAGCL